jgi:hypothetical protein
LGEGAVVEFLGKSLGKQIRKGKAPEWGCLATEAWAWDLAHTQKTNLETGQVVPILPALVAEAVAELGL